MCLKNITTFLIKAELLLLSDGTCSTIFATKLFSDLLEELITLTPSWTITLKQRSSNFNHWFSWISQSFLLVIKTVLRWTKEDASYVIKDLFFSEEDAIMRANPAFCMTLKNALSAKRAMIWWKENAEKIDYTKLSFISKHTLNLVVYIHITYSLLIKNPLIRGDVTMLASYFIEKWMLYCLINCYPLLPIKL